MAFSLFSTPQQPQQQSLFQPQSQPQPFQQNSPFFQQQQQQQQQFQQQQFQQQQNQSILFTNDKVPATYSTKWADLHPDTQKFLLQIEGKILEYRDESQRLDQCSRLYDSSVSNDGFEIETSHVVQELGGISTAMERQKAVLQELMAGAKDMLRNTEIAVRSFMILQPRFVHSKAGPNSGTPAPLQAHGVTVVPVFDFYNGLPKKPSPFFQRTVVRFDKYLGECRQWIEELEQLLFLESERNSSLSSSSSLLQSLPKVISNVHGFFVHVAAKVEIIHQYIESMKMAYLADQRRRGDLDNPFLEADRRETAKQEAAAKRAQHPTLQLPGISTHPSSSTTTQAAGLFGSSGTPAPTSVATLPTAASSGGGLSLFSTPTAATSSGFATPAPSLFGPSSGASTQTPLFVSASTPSLFGSATPAFVATPAAASMGGSLFSTPFGSGAVTGSGTSFGAASKQPRPKTRTSRR